MRGLAKLLYNLNRIVLLLLALTFLSFFLLTLDGFEALMPVAEYGLGFLPVLLIPVTISMVVVLLLRYMTKEPDEELGFGDFFAGIIAVALQIAVLVLYRAQGHEITGALATNIPDIPVLVETAAPFGMLGIAILQFLAFFFYWKADPDPRK